MTLTESLDSTRYQLDKSGSHALADFQPEDLAFWMDEATKEFVKLRYGINNNVQKSFETTEKRVDDIRTLVTTTDNLTFIPAPYYNFGVQQGVNVLQATLPIDYWILSNVIGYGYLGNCFSKVLRTKQISHDEIAAALADPFNRPTGTKLLYMFEQKTIIIFVVPGLVTDKFLITYIRRPKSILATLIGDPVNAYTNMNSQIELPDLVHNEIVKLCVRMILENIESGRYNTILNEYKDVE